MAPVILLISAMVMLLTGARLIGSVPFPPDTILNCVAVFIIALCICCISLGFAIEDLCNISATRPTRH